MSSYLIIANTVRPFEGKPIPAAEVCNLMMRHKWEYTDQPICLRQANRQD